MKLKHILEGMPSSIIKRKTAWLELPKAELKAKFEAMAKGKDKTPMQLAQEYERRHCIKNGAYTSSLKEGVAQHLNVDIEDVGELMVDGVRRDDYPDFVDAYFSYGVWQTTGKELTFDELDALGKKYPETLNDMANSKYR